MKKIYNLKIFQSQRRNSLLEVVVQKKTLKRYLAMLNMLMLTLMENLDLLQKRLVKLPLQKKQMN